MKNLRYKICFLVLIIFILYIIIFTKSRDIEDYFLSNCESATEILYHDSVSEDYDIIFFLEDNGYISCALLKEDWSGYQIIRTSGKLSLSNPGYLCSFFQDNNASLWIDWGVITDDSIRSVWAESNEMKITECKPYSYRICWLIGSGKEPQNHVEKK